MTESASNLQTLLDNFIYIVTFGKWKLVIQ
jgi:hypothetical protein